MVSEASWLACCDQVRKPRQKQVNKKVTDRSVCPNIAVSKEKRTDRNVWSYSLEFQAPDAAAVGGCVQRSVLLVVDKIDHRRIRQVLS